MKIYKDLISLRNILNLSQMELASELGLSFETINKWEKENTDVDWQKAELFYEYAYNNDICFNFIYESLWREQLKDNEVLLFHASKEDFKFPIDFVTHSRKYNDFGIAFYLGENLTQAQAYIASNIDGKILSFKLDKNDLNIINFNVERDWMIAISYYRGWIKSYENSQIIKELIQKIENADVIIAPIADNRMFDIISEYVTGTITDEQCIHSLAATNLGMQYVIKTQKALDQLSLIKELYMSASERKRAKYKRMELAKTCMDKVSLARIEYKGKGHYIEEVFI